MNRIHRWLLRLTAWRIPALGKLLNLANGTIDRLAEEVSMHRERNRFLRDAQEMRRLEFEEAAALADGHWIQMPGELPSAASAPAVRRLRETLSGIPDYDALIDDRGWRELAARNRNEFSQYGLQTIILVCRLHFLKHPLIRRGIEVSANYVFGRGFKPSSPDEDANEVIQDFFTDPRNQSILSHVAFTEHEQTLFTDGNLFFAFFTDPVTGRTVPRSIDTLEISDIITDPNDSSIPWFYRREWTENAFNPETGYVQANPQQKWYFAVGWEDIPDFPASVRDIRGEKVAVDKQGEPIPVMHIKDGGLPKQRFGCPKCYPAIEYARAYKTALEDLCTLWRALSRYAWTVETQGGAPAVAAFKQAFATNLANDLTQYETNPPPGTGSAFITTPANKLTPMKTSGATMNPDDLRRVMLMVCAAFGLGEHMVGDISVGNLATASALDRPTELMFLERQEAWRSVIQQMCHTILRRSLRAPGGKMREAMARRAGISPAEFDPDTVFIEMAPKVVNSALRLSEAKDKQPKKARTDRITVEVQFPDILSHDVEKRIQAIVQAATLDGKECIGVDERTTLIMLLSELGYEDPDGLAEKLYPLGEYEKTMDRTKEEEEPETTVKGIVQVPAQMNGKGQQAKEALDLARVTVELRRLVEKYRPQILASGETLPPSA